MRDAFRMVIVVASTLLAACPDEKPIDLSGAKPRHEMPAAREMAPPPRPTMPDGPLPIALPVVREGPTLAFAPELVIFDHNILRKPTTSTNPYSGVPSPYVRPTSLSPVGVAAKLDESAGAIALFVSKTSSATETLFLLDELKLSQVAFAATVVNHRGQLPYAFGAADATVRDRVQIDLSEDEILIGDDSVAGLGYDIFSPGLIKIIEARRGQSTIGIEARIGVRSGTTNQRLVSVLDALYAAKVEALFLYPLDAMARPSIGDHDGGGSGVPSVRIGQPNAQGDLDKAIIRRYVKRNIQKILYCYEKDLLSTPGIQGTVSVQFFIKPDGKVATSSGNGVSARVSSCVANVISEIEFPKPKGGGGVQVNYPFTFRPDGG